jgi:hypothetical protein
LLLLDEGDCTSVVEAFWASMSARSALAEYKIAFRLERGWVSWVDDTVTSDCWPRVFGCDGKEKASAVPRRRDKHRRVRMFAMVA